MKKRMCTTAGCRYTAIYEIVAGCLDNHIVHLTCCAPCTAKLVTKINDKRWICWDCPLTIEELVYTYMAGPVSYKAYFGKNGVIQH